jgi:hypothetical protein
VGIIRRDIVKEDYPEDNPKVCEQLSLEEW